MPRHNILLVTYDFPPGLSGVRRIVKFAKYLPDFGFDPIVLAAQPDQRMPLDMETLLEVEAQDYPVIRTPSLDPFQLWRQAGSLPRRLLCALPHRLGTNHVDPARQLALATKAAPSAFGRWGAQAGRFASRILLTPDERVGWLPFATTVARRILRSRYVPYILTTSYPNSTHLVGLYLKNRFNIRWIADFRDGWTQNPYFGQGPTAWHGRMNRRLEQRVAQRADAIITVSEPIARHLGRVSDPSKVHVIPNGYDLDDYRGLEPYSFDKFTLVYTGTLFMQRSPEVFFTALRILLDERPGLADCFQVIFMTRFKPEHTALIKELNLEGVVHNWGLRPYRESLRLQVSADALLVLEGEAANAEIMLTQKIFEYLAASKPVLAIAPSGALSSLVRRSRAGVVADPEDIYQIKERLMELFNGQIRYEPDEELIAGFSRRELTRQLAQVLNELPPRR